MLTDDELAMYLSENGHDQHVDHVAVQHTEVCATTSSDYQLEQSFTNMSITDEQLEMDDLVCGFRVLVIE